MAYNITGGGTYRLQSSVGLSDASIPLSSFLEPVSGIPYTMPYLNTDICYATLDPQSPTRSEFVSFTGITQNSDGTALLTGVTRGLSRSYPYTASGTYQQSHAGQSILILSDSPQHFEEYVTKRDAETISGIKTFASGATPAITDAPVNPTDAANKAYADSLAIAGAPNASTSVKGIVQEATQAQVDAKTATGSTGAKLFQNLSTQRSTLLSDYIIDTGAANAYVITPSPAISVYVTGQIFSFKSIHANTTASTINVNGLGAKNIFKNGSFALASGDIVNGGVYLIEYDGTQFQLLSQQGKPQISQSGIEIFAADAGSTDAYAVTLVPAPAAYATGMVVNFTANTLNTGASTLNVNALGAKAIVKNFNAALVTGDILAGQAITAIYDGTNFQMQSPIASLPKYAVGLTSKNLADASVTQTIAHGLGVIPKFVRFDCVRAAGTASNPAAFMTIATFDGTNTAALYTSVSSGGGTGGVGIGFLLQGSDTSSFQTGVITVDATNISVAWTKTSTPTGSFSIAWAANS